MIFRGLKVKTEKYKQSLITKSDFYYFNYHQYHCHSTPLYRYSCRILQYKAVTEKLVNFAQNVEHSFKAEVSRSRSLERGTPLDRSRTRQTLATVIHGAAKTVRRLVNL